MNELGNVQDFRRIKFFGAEMDEAVFSEARKVTPDNAVLYKGDLSEMIAAMNKSGLKFHRGLALHGHGEPVSCNVLWYDACINPDIDMIKTFANLTKQMDDDSLVYITASFLDRQHGYKGLAKRFAPYTNGCKDYRKAFIGALTYLLKCVNRGMGRKIEVVSNLLYGGGKKGSTTMLVVGFSIHKHKVASPLPYVERNFREELNEIKRRNWSVINLNESVVKHEKAEISDKRKRRIFRWIARRPSCTSIDVVNKFGIARMQAAGMRAYITRRERIAIA